MAGLCPILFAAILTATGCSRAPVVTIDNRSTHSLMNVVLSGSGFTNHIDKIPAGAAARLAVHPHGESGLGIAFDAGDRHIDVGEQGYFEAGCGYHVAVTVDPDLKVSVSSSFRSD